LGVSGEKLPFELHEIPSREYWAEGSEQETVTDPFTPFTAFMVFNEVMVGRVFTTKTTWLLLAVVGLAQDSLEVRMHSTKSPLAGATIVKLELLEPAGLPFTFHCQVGAVPWLETVLLKVTGSPAQSGLLLGCILMAGETDPVTVMLIELD
jgi:hypothetical protein